MNLLLNTTYSRNNIVYLFTKIKSEEVNQKISSLYLKLLRFGRTTDVEFLFVTIKASSPKPNYKDSRLRQGEIKSHFTRKNMPEKQAYKNMAISPFPNHK